MKPDCNCDILIIGGGPAGISTWLHLQKYAPGLAANAVLIEKSVFPRPKICAGGVGAWSQEVIDHLEIDLIIPSLFLTRVQFQYGDKSWTYKSQNPIRMVQRPHFDQALVQTGVNRGMAFHENERFIEASRVRDKLAVLTNHRKYSTKALIGADGSLSRVRRSVMGSHRACLATTLQVSAPVRPEHDKEFAQRKFLIDFSPIVRGLQGYAWHCPSPADGGVVMNHGVGDFRIHPNRPRPSMKQIFRQELKARHIQRGPDSWTSHPIRWYSETVPISEPNLLLVGDAAGIDPAFGGGIHMALTYGGLAARALIRAFEQGDFAFEHYRHDLMTHFLGHHIRGSTRLAQKIYGANGNPLDLVHEFFSGRSSMQPLLSLLLGPKSMTYNQVPAKIG
jgi:flavin-dependent dehydrogenase